MSFYFGDQGGRSRRSTGSSSGGYSASSARVGAPRQWSPLSPRSPTASSLVSLLASPQAPYQPYTSQSTYGSPQQTGGAPPQQAGGLNYTGYDADPVLQKVQAIAALGRAQATAEALKQRKQTAIDFGDVGYAQNVLGDTGTAGAAEANPFSVRARQKYDYEQGVTQLENALNQANLFYSGERGRRLGMAARGYQEEQAGSASQEQSILDAIANNLAAAMAQADYQEQMAMLQQQAAGGGDYGAPQPDYGVPPEQQTPPEISYPRPEDISGGPPIGPGPASKLLQVLSRPTQQWAPYQQPRAPQQWAPYSPYLGQWRR